MSKPTKPQEALLARLTGGTPITISYAGDMTTYWIGKERVNERTVKACLAHGWVLPPPQRRPERLYITETGRATTGGGRAAMSEGTQASCTCDSCRLNCAHKPGWFLPSEAERVADHLGVSLQELFVTKLGVDWYEEDGPHGDTFVLAPAVTHMEAGAEYPADAIGRCVFLTSEQLCAIHPVKPFECREALHGQGPDGPQKRHDAVMEAWKGHQGQIRDLLGRAPEAREPSDSDALSGFLVSLLGGW